MSSEVMDRKEFISPIVSCYRYFMKQVILLTAMVLWVGCGGHPVERPTGEAEEVPQLPNSVHPSKATPGLNAAAQASGKEAVRLFAAELAAEEAKAEPSLVQLAYINKALADALRSVGENDKASEHRQKSWIIKIKQLGPDHPDAAAIYDDMGSDLLYEGKHDKALEIYRKSLAIRLKQLGPDHRAVHGSYRTIGNVHWDMGEHDKALEYFQKALANRLKKLGPDHLEVRRSYIAIGNVH